MQVFKLKPENNIPQTCVYLKQIVWVFLFLQFSNDKHNKMSHKKEPFKTLLFTHVYKSSKAFDIGFIIYIVGNGTEQ